MRVPHNWIAGFFVVQIATCSECAGQSPAELDQTGRYIAAFANGDGGFAAAPGQSSSLGSTSSALRILKYVGGAIPDVVKTIEYVKSCVDPSTGGFAPMPGGKADTRTTAVGLMALAELKLLGDPIAARAVAYLKKAVKPEDFEDVRLAAAGLEAAVDTEPPPAWLAALDDVPREDDHVGSGSAAPGMTGGAIVALLRLGRKFPPEEIARYAEFLRKAQTSTGGWAKDDSGASDAGTSYRIMRYFWMTKERPDLARLRAYLASCRQSDGGYGDAPGAPASPGATYLATVMLYWARQLEGESARYETAGFKSLFDGRTLDGWEGDGALWSVQSGAVTGRSTAPGLDHNAFLVSNESFEDFALRLQFRLRGTSEDANSGVQFRSAPGPGTEMTGYQADLGNGWWGGLYDESRRNRVLVQGDEKAVAAVHHGDWNEYDIRAIGPDIRLALNGVTSATYREEDSSIPSSGKLGLQVHAGKPLEVAFKNIQIQRIPRPIADDSLVQGFHVRIARTQDGERRYSLFVPAGSPPESGKWPLILFLHGSGERGEDGVRPTHVGIGPAIVERAKQFRAVVVFPQARETWAAGSADATAALAVLDEVQRLLPIDPDRVVLTGLSMGGRGAWEMAASEPGRFAAVLPLCGGCGPTAVTPIARVPFSLTARSCPRSGNGVGTPQSRNIVGLATTVGTAFTIMT
jgi:prenyltransferase beta subunit